MKKQLKHIISCILIAGMLLIMVLTVHANGGNMLPFAPFDPPETEAPETEAPETDPPETEAPETDPPETEAPETDPPETEAPETDPPETNPPETDPPETDPPEPDDTEKAAVSECKRDTTCPLYTFTDLDRTVWYHDGIHFCIENKLMNGVSSNQFSPDSVLTRAMIVTVLWRLDGEPVVNYIMPFTDVKSEQWYTEAVRWAASEGIVNGYGDNTFGPNDAVTREQIMAILHRYADYKKLDSGVIFSIVPQYNYSLWAENDILWADTLGLTDGIGVDVFDMTLPAIRAEIAVYLMKFCEGFGLE